MRWIGFRRAFIVLAALFVTTVVACEGKEGFGTFKKLVPIDRVAPPQVILPVKRVAIVFTDETNNASPLRQRIESGIRTRDPKMVIADDAPYVMTIHVRTFLFGNTHSIDGTYRLSDRAGRELDAGSVSASNAGALVSDSDDELIDTAADDVLRVIVPKHYQSAVLMPRGRIDALTPMAERGEWQSFLSAAERLDQQRGEPDSYRIYALAVAHEGMAHQSANVENTVRHLREAIRLNLEAAHAKPAEQLFSEQYMRLVRTPGTPPMSWVSPHTMELWESMLRIEKWMSAPASPAGTMDNRAVLALQSAGRSDDEILAEISRAQNVRFALDHDDMIALSKAGVTWDVIDAMRHKAGLGKREFWITPDKWIGGDQASS